MKKTKMESGEESFSKDYMIKSEEDLVMIKNDIESKSRKLLEQLNRYMKALEEQNRKVLSNGYVVERLLVEKNIIYLWLNAPVPSCLCDGVENENDGFLYKYHVTCDNEWVEGKLMSFYGYCYKLNAVEVTDEPPKICVLFSTENELKDIFYKMVLSEMEYRTDWFIKNYSNLVADIQNNLLLNLEKNELIMEQKSVLNAYRRKIYNNTMAQESFYNEHRYESDSLLWQRKKLKQDYSEYEEYNMQRIWSLNSAIRKLKIPEFLLDAQPHDRHVVVALEDDLEVLHVCF